MKNPDQFKYGGDDEEGSDEWSTIMGRAQDLFDENFGEVSTEDLLEDLRMVRVGIHQIREMMRTEITADEQTMNQLYSDYELLGDVKQKLVEHLRLREPERPSIKEALHSNPDSFLENNDLLEMEEDEEETPSKPKSPGVPQPAEQAGPTKWQLKLGSNLGPEVLKELVKQGDDYYRKMKDGTKIKLNSEVEIQDEAEGEALVRKKVITLSMPRENKSVVEGLRKSNSETMPPNLQIDPDLYRRHETEQAPYDARGFQVCHNQESPDHSGVPLTVPGREASQHTDSKDLPREEALGEKTEEADRFRKQKTVSGYEEVSGEGHPNAEMWGPKDSTSMIKPVEFDNTLGSNAQVSELRSNHEMQMPFPDSQVRETNGHTESLEASKPEDNRMPPNKPSSIKKLIMSEHKFEESYTNGPGGNKQVYNNSLEPSQPITRQESQEMGSDFGGKHLEEQRVDIYSKGPTLAQEEEETPLNDTSRKFYNNKNTKNQGEPETREVDQQNETSKKPFYQRDEAGKKKNTLNDLIAQPNNHRLRMDDLAQPQHCVMQMNLESLQTVNSNWMSGREESGGESIHKATKPQTHFSEKGNKNIKSLNEIVTDNISRQNQEEDLYYNYQPDKPERVSHPDDLVQKQKPLVPIQPVPMEPNMPSMCMAAPVQRLNITRTVKIEDPDSRNRTRGHNQYNGTEPRQPPTNNNKPVYRKSLPRENENRYPDWRYRTRGHYQYYGTEPRQPPTYHKRPDYRRNMPRENEKRYPDWRHRIRGQVESFPSEPKQQPTCYREPIQRLPSPRKVEIEPRDWSNRNSQGFGFKEKRLSHRSKMIVIPTRSRRFEEASKSRGVSLEDYNKRASSITMNSSRYSVRAGTRMQETTRNGKRNRANPVNDDYGLAQPGITSNMRKSSYKKIVRESMSGSRYSRPEFSVPRGDQTRGIRVYTGEEALSRSRHTISSGRRNESGFEQHSPSIRRDSRRRSPIRNPEAFKSSTEIKVRVRPGRRHESQDPRSSRHRTSMMDSLGKYINQRVPGKMVTSINPSQPGRVNINEMINRGRESYNRITPKKLAKSISRGTSRGAGSNSSLKHEVKYRSISRSKNLMSLDEYCHKIERRSRHMEETSGGSEVKNNRRRMNDLLKNLKSMKKKKPEPDMRDEYYTLGGNGTRVERRPTPTSTRRKLSESKLNQIRKMFPFNQEWFWDLSSARQADKIRKHNPEILEQLEVPVKVLISKVRQSERVSNSWVINPKKDRVVNSFADKRVEFGERERKAPQCKVFNMPGDFDRENEEMKGRGCPPVEEDFGDVDFGGRRNQHSGFEEVGFKDRRYMEREVKCSNLPPPRNQQPRVQKGVQRRKVYATGSGYRSNYKPHSSRVIYPRSKYSENKNGVRIRNRRRNFPNDYYGPVNRKETFWNDRDSKPRTYYKRGDRRFSQNQYKVSTKIEKPWICGVGENDPDAPKKIENYSYPVKVETPWIYRMGAEDPNAPKKIENFNEVYHDRIDVCKEVDPEDFYDDYYEEVNNQYPSRDPRSKRQEYKIANPRYPRPVIKRRHEPEEPVYVEDVVIQNDDSEDFDDDYFEEKDLRSRNKGRRRQQEKTKRNKGRPARQGTETPEQVFEEKIEIRPTDQSDEEMGDDYFEERDPATWKRGKEKVHKNREKVTRNYFKKGQYVNHNRQDSPKRVYVDQVQIAPNSESEDYGDEYFEERDQPREKPRRVEPKKTAQGHKQPQRKAPGNKNVFNATYVDSGVRLNSKNSSDVQPSPNSSNLLMSGRFQSFAPAICHGTPMPAQVETHYAQVESKNEMGPNEIATSRETKGPVGNWESHSQAYNSAKKTSHTLTSHTEVSSGRPKGNVHFKDPYQAQIFTNQDTYRRNQQNRQGQNTFWDYYQTKRNRS